MRDKTEQELFWEEYFGQEYITRNQGDVLVSMNIALFANILARTRDVNSIIEFGALDYGFVYHRDHQFLQDDINWFLLEKVNDQ